MHASRRTPIRSYFVKRDFYENIMGHCSGEVIYIGGDIAKIFFISRGHQRTQRDKPSNLGEKTEDTSELNETNPPILVRNRGHANSTRHALQSGCVNMTTGIVQIDRISPWCTGKCHSLRKPHRAGGQSRCGHSNAGNGAIFTGDKTLAPDAERQVFQRHGSGQAAFQAQPFIDIPVGPAVFGSRKEIGVVHRDTNHFWIFAILRNAGNGHFNRERLATMVKHVGMGKKG
ncbi:hypothetical protein TNCV_748751 [Trichonephila clavipes]|nr:hypothetical protein TNCV_748751 [Trichonephila clavipes]